MRRTITPLSLLAAAAICILAMTSSAGAAPRAPHIVCPASDSHIVLPCCPLPPQPAGGSDSSVQPLCCQPTTCCPSAGGACCTPATCCPSGGCCPTPCTTGSLTIASSPNPSTAGRKVVISGGFVVNPVSNAQVVLWGELAGQTSFQQVAQTTTDTSGRYAFTLGRGTVMIDQAWYVSSNGVNSATLEQHVDALVGLSALSHSATVGQAVGLRGHVTPSHAGESVLIEQRRAGAWRVMAQVKLGATSNYSISHRFAQPGAVRLRAVLRGDVRNDKSVSSIFTLTVKP